MTGTHGDWLQYLGVLAVVAAVVLGAFAIGVLTAGSSPRGGQGQPSTVRCYTIKLVGVDRPSMTRTYQEVVVPCPGV